MKLGNKTVVILSFFLFFSLSLMAEDKILTSPLVNLKELKPSFEEVEDVNNDTTSNELILDKKKYLQKIIYQVQNLLG